MFRIKSTVEVISDVVFEEKLTPKEASSEFIKGNYYDVIDEEFVTVKKVHKVSLIDE